MGNSAKAKLLEAVAIARARRAREEAERARDVVVESAGRLIDEARENPELQIDEEHEVVQELAKKTGRSGDQLQAVTQPASKR